MRINRDTALEPKTYLLPDGLEIDGEDITVEGNGALLIADQQRGSGIRIGNSRNITLKNVRVQGFYHGIRAENVRNLTIQNCTVRGTAEIAANTTFLDIFKDEKDSFGGGICLVDAADSTIEGNDLQHQMTGLQSYNCKNLQVIGNLASYCSGFGFHLNRTSQSIYRENYADFCSRWHPRGDQTGHMGADAAGFLIVNSSCENKFLGNFARMSGDGFFLAGLSHDLEPNPCSDNLFENNDARWSPNIAFEATFSRGNIFRRNQASQSNYGFWLGFSSENLLIENQIHQNRAAGIAVENGVQMIVENNQIYENRYGILLWSKRIPAFENLMPANLTSRDWLIKNNRFKSNRCAIRIAANQDHGTRPHIKDGLTPAPSEHKLLQNQFIDNLEDLDIKEAVDSLVR